MDTRRALLNAARALVAAKGVKSVTVADIASQAGVAKGLLFYYFQNKDSLIRAVAEEIEAEYAASLQAMPQTSCALDNLHELFRHHFRFLDQDPEGAQFLYQSASAGTGGLAFYEHLYEAILKLLEQGAATGELHVGDVEETAYMVLGSLHGIGRLKLFEFKRDYDAARHMAAFFDKILLA